MGNQLLDTIDLIEEACAESTLDTMLALSDTYMKQAMILESVTDPVDIGSFTVFQEASTVKEINYQLGKTPISGYKDENVVKRVLLFIPRLIYHILQFCVFVAVAAVAAIGALIALGVGGIYKLATAKQRERESTEILELDFDPEFICNFIEAYYEVIAFVANSSDISDHYRRDLKYPIVDTINTVMNYTDTRRLKSLLSSFDKDAYRKMEMSRDAAKTSESTLKGLIASLKFVQRKVKHEMKGMNVNEDFDVPQEYRKSIIEFNNLNAECGKKLSELKVKLDELHKDIKNKETLYKTAGKKA